MTRYLRTYEAVGGTFSSTDHAVAFDRQPRSLLLPPPLRATVVVRCDAPLASELIAPLAGHVAALGGSGDGELFAAMSAACPKARRSPIGRMQKPPLDGPVDQRTQLFTTVERG